MSHRICFVLVNYEISPNSRERMEKTGIREGRVKLDEMDLEGKLGSQARWDWLG